MLHVEASDFSEEVSDFSEEVTGFYIEHNKIYGSLGLLFYLASDFEFAVVFCKYKL